MKKLLCVLLVFALAIPAFAQTLKVTGTAPTVGGTNQPLVNLLNAKLKNDTFQDQLNELIREFTFDSPTKFLQGMGNSSVYASHGATTRGYGGYKIFSATIGTTIGLQLPESLFSILSDPEGSLDSFTNDIKNDGDIKFGFSPNLFNINVGLNMGVFKFIPQRLGILKRDNLYVGLRVGYFKLPTGLFEGVSYSSFTLGTTVNYQIIPTVGLGNFIKWRGLNVGTGFIYNGASASYTVPVEVAPKDFSVLYLGTDYHATLNMDPKFQLNFNEKTFTIPLEAVTAIKLLIFNIPLGLGVDIAFGKTSVSGGVTSDIRLTNISSPDFYQATKGDLKVSGEISNSPSVFNFKIMTGLGINAGPVVFDVPLTIYPAVNGYTVGITAGAVY